MGNLATHIKYGYITAKGLRLASICSTGVRLQDLGVTANIDIEKYITTYRFKTYILKHKEGQPSSKCRFEWADAIYREIQQSLEQERCDRLWYDEKRALLDCRYHKEMHVCCSKRKLILALIQEIRTWLAANIIQLKSE